MLSSGLQRLVTIRISAAGDPGNRISRDVKHLKAKPSEVYHVPCTWIACRGGFGYAKENEHLKPVARFPRGSGIGVLRRN